MELFENFEISLDRCELLIELGLFTLRRRSFDELCLVPVPIQAIFIADFRSDTPGSTDGEHALVALAVGDDFYTSTVRATSDPIAFKSCTIDIYQLSFDKQVFAPDTSEDFAAAEGSAALALQLVLFESGWHLEASLREGQLTLAVLHAVLPLA